MCTHSQPTYSPLPHAHTTQDATQRWSPFRSTAAYTIIQVKCACGCTRADPKAADMQVTATCPADPLAACLRRLVHIDATEAHQPRWCSRGSACPRANQGAGGKVYSPAETSGYLGPLPEVLHVSIKPLIVGGLTADKEYVMHTMEDYYVALPLQLELGGLLHPEAKVASGAVSTMELSSISYR